MQFLRATLLLGGVLGCVVLTGTAGAQVRKCVGPDGKITYSDVLCANNAKSAQTIDARAAGVSGHAGEARASMAAPAAAAAPPARASQASVYERELTGKIAGHLLYNDFDLAATIAVTPEHHQMIASAKRDKARSDRADHAAEQAAKPTVCTTKSVSDKFGGIRSYTITSECKR